MKSVFALILIMVAAVVLSVAYVTEVLADFGDTLKSIMERNHHE